MEKKSILSNRVRILGSIMCLSAHQMKHVVWNFDEFDSELKTM